MAIELHESETPGSSVSRESDMWAFGMFCIEVRSCQKYPKISSNTDIMAVWQLLTGHPPFRGQSEGMVVVNIMAGRMPERPCVIECQDHHWKLIRRCWENDPKVRPSAYSAAEELRKVQLVE